MSQASCTRSQTTRDRSRSLSNRASHEVCAKNSSWDSPGLHLVGFGALLGGCWASLDRLLGALGWLLAPLGRFLAASWALLGRSWSPLRRFSIALGHPSHSKIDFATIFVRFFIDVRSIFRRFRDSLACVSRELAIADGTNSASQERQHAPQRASGHVRRVVALGCARGFRKLFVRACFGANMQAHLVYTYLNFPERR